MATRRVVPPEDESTVVCGVCGTRVSLEEYCMEHAAACAAAKHARVVAALGLGRLLGDLFDVGLDGHSGADANEVAPNLYLGSVSAARDEAFLRETRVVAIVNCAAEVRPLPLDKRAAAGVASHVQFDIDDVSTVDFTDELTSAAAAIDAGMRLAAAATATASAAADAPTTPHAVLVHCAAGVSRSATAVLLYLMRYHGMTLWQAARRTKAARTCISPNMGFWKVLRASDVALHGAPSLPAAALRVHPEAVRTQCETEPLPATEAAELAEWLAAHAAEPAAAAASSGTPPAGGDGAADAPAAAATAAAGRRASAS